MPKKILIVDDDRLNTTLLEFSLRGKGYETTTVHDGHQALKSLAIDKPDLIILDIHMPNMNGFEFMVHLQGKKEGKIPVLILTANDTMQDVFFMEGIRGYLVKPVDIKVLEEKISACLR